MLLVVVVAAAVLLLVVVLPRVGKTSRARMASSLETEKLKLVCSPLTSRMLLDSSRTGATEVLANRNWTR